MKKLFKILTLATMTALGFTSCSGTGSSYKSSDKTTSSEFTYDDTPSNYDCINVILPPLLTAINDIENLSSCAVMRDSSDTIDEPSYGVSYYRVKYAKFCSLADIDYFINSYFTSDIRADKYADIIDTDDCSYIEKDGALYVSDGKRSNFYEWSETPAVIKDKTSVSFTAEKRFEKLGTPAYVRISVVKGDYGWLIDNLEVVNDDSDDEIEGYKVYISDFGNNKIQVIKVVREITGCGISDAVDLVDSIPTYLKYGLSLKEAETIKSALEEAGATVKIE